VALWKYSEASISGLLDTHGGGANILVTMANDSWFGNNESLDWRLASGAFRSVETRLPWVRVGNTGYTLYADRAGRIDWDNRLPAFKKAIASYDVAIGDPRSSIYNYTIGPTRLALIFVAVWGLWMHRKMRIQHHKSEEK